MKWGTNRRAMLRTARIDGRACVVVADANGEPIEVVNEYLRQEDMLEVWDTRFEQERRASRRDVVRPL